MKVSNKTMNEFVQRYIEQEDLVGEGILEQAYIYFTGLRMPEGENYPGSWYPDQLEKVTPITYWEWQELDALEHFVLASIHPDSYDLVGLVLLYYLGEISLPQKRR